MKMAGRKQSNTKGDDFAGHERDDEKQLNEKELEELYAWVDKIPLSRPKRNIGRDFSDGVLVAEIVHHILPKLIDMHNYSGANNSQNKQHNWEVLNRYIAHGFPGVHKVPSIPPVLHPCKMPCGNANTADPDEPAPNEPSHHDLQHLKVFSKMNFELAEDVINDLVSGKSGMIEKVLLMLQVKIRRILYEKERPQNPKPEADQHQVSPGRSKKTLKVGMDETKGHKFAKTKHIEQPNPAGITKRRPPGNSSFDDKVPRLLVEEREQELLAKDEMVKIMQAKISRMEHLLHLKDLRIDDLQGQVESLRPTGLQYRPQRKQ